MVKNLPGRSTNSWWWHSDCGYLCVVPTNNDIKINGCLVMGAGLAKAVAEEFPDAPQVFGNIVKTSGPGVYIAELKKKKELRGLVMPTFKKFIIFPTKQSWREQSSLNLIEQSLDQLVQLANEKKLENIYLPKIGCGLGGLIWSDVEKILNEKLDERFTIPV